MTAVETSGGSISLGAQPDDNRSKMTPRQPFLKNATRRKGKKNDENDDEGDALGPQAPSAMLSGLLPHLATLCVRSAVLATVALYVLNQKHLLPRPMTRVVSKLLFWPTMPITLSRRLGQWTTVVDDAMVIGGVPFGWCGYPEKLAREFNVRAVINMCDEYRGPVSSYERLGIEQLRLPTIDHFEPSVEDLKKAVSFIAKHEARGGRVYVHCRAGHGRSAAVVLSYLLYKDPLARPFDLNEKLCALRNVRTSLWRQPNINSFRMWLKNGGMVSDSEGDDDDHSLSGPPKMNSHRVDRPADIVLPGSRIEDRGSDDSNDDMVHPKLGQISDEDSAAEDSSEESETLDDTEGSSEEKII